MDPDPVIVTQYLYVSYLPAHHYHIIIDGPFLTALVRHISQRKALRSSWWATAKVHIVSGFTGVHTSSG